MKLDEDIEMVVELLKKVKSNNDLRSYILITSDGFTVNVSRSGNYEDLCDSLVAAFNDNESMMKTLALDALEKMYGNETK